MSPLLWRSVLRHLTHHPWQMVLAIVGIALGVAVVLAVDLANTSARKSFLLSMEQVTGRTTHRIVGATQNLSEEVYVRLRLELGLHQAAPVIVGYVVRADQSGILLQILGVDFFAEEPFRSYLNKTENINGSHLTALFTEPDTALLSSDLEPLDRLTVKIGENQKTLRPIGRLNNPLLKNLIITDIATAQALLHMQGRLSHIDLIIPEGTSGKRLLNKLENWLPPGLRLERTAARNQATVQLNAAFSLNLTAMSLLALVVGMFLIYNTMTFSVVQRRGLLGILRALGVNRREIFTLVLSEALLLGLVGTLLGGLLGIGLGSFLVQLVTRTVNDLYYVLSVREFYIAPWSLAKAVFLGLIATAVAAWLPAREAAAAPPGVTLSRAYLESRWQANLTRLNGAGIAFLALSGLVFALSRGLFMGFIGLFLMILGCALLTPGCVIGLVRINRAVTAWSGLLVRMASRDVARHLSRTGIAVAALMIAFSSTVGVGVMVDSFRSGVTLWIKDLINADIYIAPPAPEESDYSPPLHPEVVTELRSIPGIAAVSTYRRIAIDVDGKPIQLLAVDLAPQARSGYHLIKGDPDSAWQAFTNEAAVIISEPLAYRLNLGVGDTMILPTQQGPRHFAIAGIFLDYGSEHGRIVISRDTYRRLWHDETLGSAAAYAAPGEDLSDLRQRLEDRIGPLQKLIIRSNRDIQTVTLNIFERTFTITRVLRLLAIAVAFVGVLSALMAVQLERTREFAILRATGMTSGEIGWLISLQTVFMGFIAGLLAIPVGLALAYLLISVINRRAFGWTLPFQVDPWILLQAVLLATLAALLAGIYPIWRMARSNPSQALRSE